MLDSYLYIEITTNEAEDIVKKIYAIVGTASALNGEIDFNFKITSNNKIYVLKISRPDVDIEYTTFQDDLLKHIEAKNPDFVFPKTVRDKNGIGIFDTIDKNQLRRKVRLLEWIEGDLYSNLSYKNDQLHYSLGKKCGQNLSVLSDFNHQKGIGTFDWDIANALWIEGHLHLFSDEKKAIISKFIDQFKSIHVSYNLLRKSTIHNDSNDNNIIVKNDKQNPECIGLIDFGDAVYSQIINDVAVTLAYAMMGTEQPLQTAMPIVKGYNQNFPLHGEELKVLYTCVAMRLAISVTKSAINKVKEPENKYLQISEKPAWDLLEKWEKISPFFAYYSFRNACGMEPCPQTELFVKYTSKNEWKIEDLLPIANEKSIESIDLSIDSKFIGNYSNYIESENIYQKIEQYQNQKNAILVGGYGEARPIYTTDAYKIKQNEGFEHRTIHLGIDFWTDVNSDIAAIENGVIFSVFNNNSNKDYGPTIILKHQIDRLTFFTLYGHLSVTSLINKKAGDAVSKGEVIGQLGNSTENGGWGSHLHFQIMLDMLDLAHDFYGVSTPSLWPIYSSICPDPNLFFKHEALIGKKQKSLDNLIEFRKKHLGKSLSISYKKPLKIVRGERQYLIDDLGQKYLDTVNNVAHVGHEHPYILEKGMEQMGVLNTNTRYINEEILNYAKALLKKFPSELNVVHFVNSGSEANELALRMARAYSGQKDVIALEVGYHGNTQGCIDISSYKFDGKGGKGCPENTHIIPLPDAFRGKYTGDNTSKAYANHVKEAIQNIQEKGRNVSAFIAESIVSCGGQVDLPNGYLSDAYAYVRAAGGLCIADEVQVGFGRVGKSFWGFELHNVIPDIVTLGKPIGNGHPLAAVVCTRAVADAFANGMEFFNTFGGNPVSCAIGKAVLETIENEKLQENALNVGNYLKNKLKNLQENYPIIGDVRGEGLFLGIEFVDQNKNPLPLATSYLVNRMLDFKILMSIDGPDNNVLKIKPPMCFTITNADYSLETLENVLKNEM